MNTDHSALIERSKWLRKELLKLVVTAKKGHIPSCYSCSEIVLTLFYGGYFNCDSKSPKQPDRDRIFISKGHAAMVLYPILADKGFIDSKELLKFTRADGSLRLYADQSIPGIESPTGSLGHGMGIGCGHAFTAKLDKKDYWTYVVVGDGECYEGSIWETALFAAHYKLDNFVTFVDRNQLCIMDSTETIMRLSPLAEKWKSFGWNTIEVNGHSYKELTNAMNEIRKNRGCGKPTAVICNTVKGKGISFMENQSGWHNKIMNDDQVRLAEVELEKGCITE